MASGKKPAPSTPQTALISGASSGIGEAMAHCFAKAGYQLVLVARSTDKLKALAKELGDSYGVKVWVTPADLSQPDAAQTLAAAMKRAKRPIDILVNSAGVLQQGAFVDMSQSKLHSMIDLNISGLTAMVAQFAPPMVARGYGRILNVASVAAFQPVPTLAVYAATKAYVLSLTEALSEEFKGTGVTITALCPGITATAMLSGAAEGNAAISKLPSFLIGDAHDVAQQGFDACMAGQVIRVPGAVNHAAITAGRATPKWLLRTVGGMLMRRLK